MGYAPQVQMMLNDGLDRIEVVPDGYGSWVVQHLSKAFTCPISWKTCHWKSYSSLKSALAAYGRYLSKVQKTFDK